jgi:hypothetical protein
MFDDKIILKLLNEILERLSGDSTEKKKRPFNGQTTAFLALILGILLGVVLAIVLKG